MQQVPPVVPPFAPQPEPKTAPSKKRKILVFVLGSLALITIIAAVVTGVVWYLKYGR
jgi:quinol-cytochrome oxidoreductase complex cytochrome b subunit